MIAGRALGLVDTLEDEDIEGVVIIQLSVFPRCAILGKGEDGVRWYPTHAPLRLLRLQDAGSELKKFLPFSPDLKNGGSVTVICDIECESLYIVHHTPPVVRAAQDSLLRSVKY